MLVARLFLLHLSAVATTLLTDQAQASGSSWPAAAASCACVTSLVVVDPSRLTLRSLTTIYLPPLSLSLVYVLK